MSTASNLRSIAANLASEANAWPRPLDPLTREAFERRVTSLRERMADEQRRLDDAITSLDCESDELTLAEGDLMDIEQELDQRAAEEGGDHG